MECNLPGIEDCILTWQQVMACLDAKGSGQVAFYFVQSESFNGIEMEKRIILKSGDHT